MIWHESTRTCQQPVHEALSGEPLRTLKGSAA
jgi:hypothetical protein